MPKTRNALMRYRIIDECLSNCSHMPSSSHDYSHRGIWSLSELQDKIFEKLDIDISGRQIEQDIRDMRNGDLGYYAPIENKRGIGYYYSEPDFKITDNPLTESDLRWLTESVEILKQFTGFKYFEDLDGLIYKLEEKVNKAEYQKIQLDTLNNTIGLEWISLIKNALHKEWVLKMVYNPFFGESKEKLVHPYVLKEYNNRWFLLCYSEDYKTEGIYALDRISELERIEKKYRKPDKKFIDTYFSEIIGVTNIKEEPVQEIILKLTKQRAFYLKTKPIHKSQEIDKEDEDFVWFSFRLKINNELTALILGFGKDIEVEKPVQLAEQLKKIYQDAFNQYH